MRICDGPGPFWNPDLFFNIGSFYLVLKVNHYICDKNITHTKMKNIYTLLLSSTLAFLASTSTSMADPSRGLWACQTVKNDNVFVSWRMRGTDAPKSTTYKLYADGKLVKEFTDRTNTMLSKSYANSTFSVEVYDKNGEMIDSQEGVKCDGNFFHQVKLSRPQPYQMNNTSITYTPNDCSSFDMDGDGEQEIIVKWEPSNAGETAKQTGPQILDCYKLNGQRLWRIDFGPNVLAGCRFTFLCYDFDGDGYGELIAKTAQGSKDATGNFLSKGVAQGANHNASSVNSAGVITDGGKEWITCFDGRTGKELATVDYWPYFNIQRDWADPREGKSDGNQYGHRGNWMKACVAFLDVNGNPKPCAVTTRGIYGYSYAAAYTWDGNNLQQLWKHTSDQLDQGIYGEGAHSITCGDVDGDGFDEIIVGAAALDHDGKLLWRTGYGHGDATHLGEFDPNHDGMEYFMITEGENAPYDGVLLDARTGKVLRGKNQTGGDTGRGIVFDCDDQYDGAEAFVWSNAYLFSVTTGKDIAEWHTGSTKSSSINFCIYWDGDLLREYHDRSHIDKWNSKTKTWDRVIDVWRYGGGANNNNSTKYNPCLQCDLYGDWREEAVYWAESGNDCYLNIYTTTTESQYKLPWLRDDHVYDMAIAWQNCGYNQPPHLGYSPVDYYKNLANMKEPASLVKKGDGEASQEVTQGEEIVPFYYTFDNASSVEVISLPAGINYTVEGNSVSISGVASDQPGEYVYAIIAKGEGGDASKTGKFIIHEGTGVSMVEAEDGCLSICPNPMTETTEVTVNLPAKQQVDWEIIDMLGVRRQGGTFFVEQRPVRFSIDRNAMESGSYLLIITTRDKNYQGVLMVK